jgi:hypothetical protein
MIGKFIGAVIGKRIGERYGTGSKGALLGAVVPIVLRRLSTPLILAGAGVYAAKRIRDHRRASNAVRT